jgi:hypothetical protein
MRTVFDNRMVAHVWAQQSQREGRSNNGQLFFDGPTIFSYGRHFPIARFAVGKNGVRYVLFTTRDYSITTSKHKSFVRQSLTSAQPIYYVRDVTADPRGQFEEAIAERLKYAANEQSEKRRGHERRALEATSQAARIAERANEFAAFTGERWRLKVPAVDVATVAKFAASEARKRAKAAKAAAAKEALRLEAFKRAQAEWIAGALDYLPGTFDAESGGAALRIVGDELQTSHGARVPLAHAIKAFRFLKLVRERGQEWHRNGHSLRVGHFTIDRIAPNGDFVAGCHDIRWAEVERVARLAGVFDTPANDCALSLTKGEAA